MKFKFKAWLSWLLIKLPIFKNLRGSYLSSFKVGMLQHIEEMSDEGINYSIKDIKEGNWSKEPYRSLKTFLDTAGINFEIILGWLEDEKFLREHRRKYQQKTDG